MPYSIGSYSDGYRGSYSDPYTLETGQTLHLTFVNNNNGTANGWNNFILEATSAVDKHDGVYFDMRADNYAFGAGTFVQNYNGNQKSDLDGATVDMDVTYAGGIITVEGIYTKAKVTTYHSKYTYSVAGSPASVVIYLTEEAAVLNITKAEISSWSTVWNTDFSSAPSGMTYSVTNGSCGLAGEHLYYNNEGAGAARAINTAFTDAAFNVATNWIMEFDWNCHASNTTGNTSNVVFATNNGTAFTITWNGNTSDPASIIDGNSTSLTTTLPTLGTSSRGTLSSTSHFKISGVAGTGIYLTVTNGGVTYVNNQLVTSTFGYPSTFNGSLGRAYAWMYLDNIIFRTPAIAGFVATPTYTITAPDGTNRKFTLDCITDGATIYYATSDLEKGAAGWIEYASEVSTDATTIYTYAKKGSDTSEKTSFATGAGEAIKLNTPTITKTAYATGNYTVSISSDQSNRSIVPASPTIKYAIDGGEAQNYSAPFAVAGGKTVTAWVVNTGYTDSDVAECETAARPNYPQLWTQDYTNKVEGTTGACGVVISNTDGGDFTVGETPYYNIVGYTKDAATVNVELNTNVGLAVTTNFNLRTNGANSGILQNGSNQNVGFQNLKVGDYVIITTNGNNLDGGTGLTLKSTMSTSSEYVFEATATEGEIRFYKGTYAYIKTITVYRALATPGATVNPTYGYATFAANVPLDLLTLTEGFTAYVATSVAPGAVTMSSHVGMVPAGTGLFIKGSGAFTITETREEPTTPATNYLVGVTANGTVTASAGGTYHYVFAVQEDEVAFFNVATDAAITAGKAYLETTTDIKPAAGARVAIIFDDESTGISTMQNSQFTMHNDVYDLQGRRVAAPTKGLYIVNGKKVVIK